MLLGCPPTSVSTVRWDNTNAFTLYFAPATRSRQHRAAKQLLFESEYDNDERGRMETKNEPFDRYFMTSLSSGDKVLGRTAIHYWKNSPLWWEITEFAEALLTESFFVVLIILTQEALTQINGANYVPFTKARFPEVSFENLPAIFLLLQ
jgi:hypothetical protein